MSSNISELDLMILIQYAVLKNILTIGEYDVAAESVDGIESVEKYSQTNHDLLLLDLAILKKDGLQVFKEIISKHSDAKIILITASEDQKLINDCMANDAKSYISKPFNFNDVLKVILDSRFALYAK